MFEQGISGVTRVWGDEAAGPPLERIKGGATLADLKEQYELFTYAPLFLYGGLEHNPVQEWINTNHHKQIVFIMELERPFLSLGKGFEKSERTLWMVEKEHWPSLALHIGSMAMIDRQRNSFTTVACQELPVPDVVAKSNSTVNIFAFVPDGSKGCIALEPGTALTGRRPFMKFHPPTPKVAKLGAALLANKPDPYQHVQPLPWEEKNEDRDPPAS